MRVVIAPDSFGGSLTASEAAETIADGWSIARPTDELVLIPLADGGPGFVEVLSSSLGGDLLEVACRDPFGRSVGGAILATGERVFVESAQACGLHLTAPGERDPLRASTVGVGDLLSAAAELGAREVVVGLGGSGTNDGGAGMLQALGWEMSDAAGEPISPVPLSLSKLRHLRSPAHLSWPGLVAATDVDNPLLGPSGATAVFARQKGAGAEEIDELEGALANLARVAADDLPGAAGLELVSGSGAAGGLGYGLCLLGGRIESGVSLVLDAVDLEARLHEADLVITGEGSFDLQSLRGKVVSGVAGAARAAAVSCVVMAGRVELSERDIAACGVSGAWSVVDEAGSLELSLAEPGRFLSRLAARVASSATSLVPSVPDE